MNSHDNNWDDRRLGRDDYGANKDRRRRSISPRRNDDDRRERDDDRYLKLTSDPMKENYLMDFREFSSLSRDRSKGVRAPLDMDELEKRYEAYKINFVKLQHEKFFKQNSLKEWFREKYHPKESLKFKEQQNQRKIEQRIQFESSLNQSKYDTIIFDELNNSLNEQNTFKELENHTNNYLYIKSIPEGVKRMLLFNHYQKYDGFKYLEISQPRPDRDNSKIGWIVFEPEVNIAEIVEKVEHLPVDGFNIVCTAPRYYKTKLFTAIYPEYNRPGRFVDDLKLAKTLAETLDAEVGFPKNAGSKLIDVHFETVIRPAMLQRRKEDEDVEMAKAEKEDSDEEMSTDAVFSTDVSKDPESKDGAKDKESKEAPVLSEAEKQKEKEATLLQDNQDQEYKKQLDLYILYLNRVHFYDFYTGCESNSPEDHRGRGGLPSRPKYISRGDLQKLSHDKQLSTRIALRTNTPNLETKATLGYKDLESQIDISASLYIRKEGENKFRCIECQKLFRGDDFVRKHVKSKHEGVISHVEDEVLFFNEYVKFADTIDVVKTNYSKTKHEERLDRDRRERGLKSLKYSRGRENGRDREVYQYQRGGDRRRSDNYTRDGRGVRSYQDLDAPVMGDVQISYE